MGGLMNFTFESHEVRTVIRDGEPWFVASDVCTVLELSNPSEALKRLDDDERTLISIEGASNGLPVNAVSESGLYSLVIGSRKQEAKAFKRWITHEVIPSIRKTGSYSVEPSLNIDKLDPQMQVIYRMVQSMATTQIELKEARQELGQVKETVQTMQETFLRHDEDWRESITSLMSKAAFQSGVEYRVLWSKSYEILDERAHCELDKRLKNLRRRMETEGATKTNVAKANKLDVIETDARLKEIYTTIVKELSIGSMQAVGR